MISMNRVGDKPVGEPLISDDIIEFHAARILLLILVCGTKKKIEGLTKMAKLDFFVRYPAFFDHLTGASESDYSTSNIESPMTRYHYGPWDQRYYQVLSFLESRSLTTIVKVGSQVQIELTDDGQRLASELKKNIEFRELVSQMEEVKKALGGKSGSALKKLIYKSFDEEVAKERMGNLIL